MLAKNSIFLFLFACLSTFNIFAQTADVTQGCTPLTVKFTNKAGVSNPFWVFNDGSGNSTELKPERIFTKAGVYNVELRAGSATGAVLGTVTISVFNKPEVTITATPLTGCVPLSVDFKSTIKKDAAIVINDYSWAFGDNNVSSNENAKNVYTKEGSYKPTFAIKTNFPSCNTTIALANDIKTTASPVASFKVDNASACEAPLTVNFTNQTQPTTGTSFAWDFGNNIKSQAENPLSQQYTKNGTYTVTLVATNAQGCKSTFSSLINIGRPKVSFSFPNDTLCLLGTYTPNNASSEGNYFWTFGSGAKVTDPTIKQPTVYWETTGTKAVNLKVTDFSGKCTKDTTITIFVEENKPQIKTTSASACQNPIKVTFESTKPMAVYDWSIVYNTLVKSNLAKPTVDLKNTDPSGYSKVGKFTVKTSLISKSYAGCEGFITKLDTFNIVNARIVPDKWQGCVPLTVTFADSSFSKEPTDTYTFLWGDGSAPQTFNSKADRAHTFTKAGEYKVRMILKNKAGCIDTSHVILIEVGDKITPNFSADKTTVCPGDTVKFKDLTSNKNIDAWHFSTNHGRSWHCFTSPNLNWVYDSVGKFPVTLTVGYNGCFSTATKNDYITVKGPLAKIDFKMQCNPKNRDVIFNSLSQDATTLSWDFGDTTNATIASLTHTYKYTGDFKVKLTATNPNTGCKSSTDSVIVHVRDLAPQFEIFKVSPPVQAGYNLCQGTQYELKSKKSKDVHKSCYSGFTWMFSDPNERPVTTSLDSIVFIPRIPKDYTLKLIVKDINGCVDTVESKHYVYNTVVQLASLPNAICMPFDLSVSASATTVEPAIVKSWEWKLDGNSLSTKQQDILKLSGLVPRKYILEAIATDDKECPGSATKEIEVYKPTSTISVIKSPTCVGSEIVVSGTDFTEKGNKLSFSWDFEGKKYSEQTFKHIAQSEGKKRLTLDIVESNTNCKNTITGDVEIQVPPNVTFNYPKVICGLQQVDFTNETKESYTTNYTWSFSDGKKFVDQKNVQKAGFSPKGTYKVTLTATTSGGCVASKDATFNVIDQPKGDFSISKSPVCLGEPITFTMKDTIGVKSYLWELGDGLTKSNTNPYTHTYQSRDILVAGITKVKLKLTAIDGACETVVEKEVSINQVIADFAILNNGACANELIKFSNNSKGADKYSWNFGDGNSSTNSVKEINNQYPRVNPAPKYTVTLSVEDTKLGCKDQISKELTLIVPTLGNNIDVPSIFTPDGTIDEDKKFKFYQKSNTGSCVNSFDIEYFEVFNRWGQRVYSSKGDSNQANAFWNGKQDNTGADLAAEVYVAIFHYKDNVIPPFKTDVTLVR
jgi:PKD repeat protein